jgi:nitroimidazol reductase NimA-like FMN-containing flavoprotein (pyridoxamine 5'-phosphate oxidase superfamily)
MAAVARPLREEEIAGLLARDVVARVATIDADGYPHVTPLWFLWADGAIHLASDAGRPHLARLRDNPRAGLVIGRGRRAARRRGAAQQAGPGCGRRAAES